MDTTVKRSIHGFTLIEMLVAVAIVSIVMAIGIPSYKSVTTSNRTAAEMNALVGDLQFARSEAIQRGQTVTMCNSANGTSCLGTNAWTPGWIVFSDPNGNDTVDAGETVLRRQAAMQGGDTLNSNAAASPGAITFNRNGFTANAQTLTLSDSDGSTAQRRCGVISLVGRVRLDTGANCP